MKNLNNIINQAIAEGGATLFNYSNISYCTGWQVAKQDTRKVNLKKKRQLWFICR